MAQLDYRVAELCREPKPEETNEKGKSKKKDREGSRNRSRHLLSLNVTDGSTRQSESQKANYLRPVTLGDAW
jgi:hypothetical protein